MVFAWFLQRYTPAARNDHYCLIDSAARTVYIKNERSLFDCWPYFFEELYESSDYTQLFLIKNIHYNYCRPGGQSAAGDEVQ